MEISIPLGSYADIFLAELRAIIAACHTLLDKDCKDEMVYICVDSQAALKALRAYVQTSALSLECWKIVNQVAKNNNVKLVWVPAHSGIEGNESADTLAKAAALSNISGPEPIIKVPHSSKRRKLLSLQKLKFQEHWNNVQSCRQAKECIRINNNNTKYLVNVSRTRLKLYTGVVTGHYGFNTHLTNIGLRTDPSCDQCGHHSDTAEHFLCDCPAYIMNRCKHFGGYIIKYQAIKHMQPKDILNYIVSTERFQDVAYA
ncbi:uncharacterized protein LOC119081116 [Bradysia coprophila]|uniref:uncharacterized protein LOC119081116 n=1 Tax=Bradysia coprophila TaxID=38358 RepID=UPI00187D7198|nr:uncharacterized protein LOC119081116 [Bradysia coprophila]